MREKARALLEKTNGYEPDEDEVDAFVEFGKSIAPSAGAPQITPEVLNTHIEAVVENRERQRLIKEAQDEYVKDNADIYNNPEYQATATAISQSLRVTKGHLSPAENLRESARLTRLSIPALQQVETDKQTQDRVDRKRYAAGQVPRTASTRPPRREAKKRPTSSDIVAKIREQRGQTSY
jgi:hypothetical protein